MFLLQGEIKFRVESAWLRIVEDVAGYAAFRVRAAFTAAVLRARLPRFAELFLACRDIAFRLALRLDSCFSAPEIARERLRDVL